MIIELLNFANPIRLDTFQMILFNVFILNHSSTNDVVQTPYSINKDYKQNAKQSVIHILSQVTYSLRQVMTSALFILCKTNTKTVENLHLSLQCTLSFLITIISIVAIRTHDNAHFPFI